MNYRVTFLAILSSAFMSISTSYGSGVSLDQTISDKIKISKQAIFPEDIKYNSKTGNFVIGSFREGAVYEVDDKGQARLLIKDDKLISALGIQLDISRNRIYVATANLGSSVKVRDNVKKLAGLGVYNLETGEGINFIDLGALLPNEPHLANGITMDDAGNIYVTDSFSPVIYKVTPQGTASIFLQSKRFEGKGINLNGIAYHSEGYFIVAMKSEGRLFKVPKDNPKDFSEIKIPKKLIGLDGVTLVNQKDIVVVANRTPDASTNAAFAIHSDDKWLSGTIGSIYQFEDVYPTTNVVKNGSIYGMYSRIGDLVTAPDDKKSTLHETAVLQKIGRLK